MKPGDLQLPDISPGQDVGACVSFATLGLVPFPESVLQTSPDLQPPLELREGKGTTPFWGSQATGNPEGNWEGKMELSVPRFPLWNCQYYRAERRLNPPPWQREMYPHCFLLWYRNFSSPLKHFPSAHWYLLCKPWALSHVNFFKKQLTVGMKVGVARSRNSLWH